MTSVAETERWSENSASRSPSAHPWRELFRSRQLVGYLALRDLKLRYRQAALGVLWVLIQPLVGVVVFTFVFHRVASVDANGIPYPVFALTGLVTWTYFSTAVTRASDILVGNPNLVTKVYFHRLAAPAAGLVSPLLDFVVSAVLMAAMIAYYGLTPGLPLLAVPLWLLFMVETTFGFAVWLSALNVRYRDVQHAIAPVLQLWLFASPVGYAGTAVSGWKGLVYAVNPLVGLIDVGRWSLLQAPWPGWPLAVSAGSSLVVLVTGVRYFRRAERTFADVI